MYAGMINYTQKYMLKKNTIINLNLDMYGALCKKYLSIHFD